MHLHRPALRYQVQLQLPVVNDQPRRQGRQRRAHYPRAGAGEGVSGYVAGWDSFVFDVFAGSADGGAGFVDGEWVGVCADWGRECASGAGADGRGVWEENFLSQINVVKTSGLSAADRLSASTDIILWYAKSKGASKYRHILLVKDIGDNSGVMYRYVRDEAGVPSRLGSSQKADPETAYRLDNLTKPGPGSRYEIEFNGRKYTPGARWWGTTEIGMSRIKKAERLAASGNTISFLRAWQDYAVSPLNNLWTDTATGGFLEQKVYVVQTTEKIVQRCVLMATDPGDLVLDPTCALAPPRTSQSSGAAAGSPLTLPRRPCAGPRPRHGCPLSLLPARRQSRRQIKEAELARKVPSEAPTYNDIRQGFVYERVPHITLKSIANNAEIDVIYEKFQETLEPLRAKLNDALGTSYEEWEIPRDADDAWPEEVKRIHADWWEQRIARQKEIDASIAAKADYEYLYDKPYEDNKKVRVAGPFTVESLSPHRLLGVDEDDELIDNVAEAKLGYGEKQDFAEMILDNLKTSGVQQAHKDDRISFSGIRPWPGYHVCAEGTYVEGNADSGAEKRAGIFVGPGIRHRLPPRSRISSARGRGRRLRRAGRLRLQLRRPRLGIQQTRPRPRPQGPHERRPPHGR